VIYKGPASEQPFRRKTLQFDEALKMEFLPLVRGLTKKKRPDGTEDDKPVLHNMSTSDSSAPLCPQHYYAPTFASFLFPFFSLA
jgi:hypothetical protein